MKLNKEERAKHFNEQRINYTDEHNVLANSAYDEKKDFTCGCLYTCNVCLEADKLNVSRREHYNKTVNDDYDY